MQNNQFIELFEKNFNDFKKTDLGSISVDVLSCQLEKCFTEKENSIYITKMGEYFICSDIHTLPRNHNYFFQVELKQEINSKYIEMFLKSDLGKHSFTKIKSADPIHYLEPKDIKSMEIYIPDRKMQDDLSVYCEKIEAIEQSLNSLKSKIFRDPELIKNTIQSIDQSISILKYK